MTVISEHLIGIKNQGTGRQGSHLNSLLQVGKLRHGGVKRHAQAHTRSQWQSQELKSALLICMLGL